MAVDQCADPSRSPQISQQWKISPDGREYRDPGPGNSSVWLRLLSPGRTGRSQEAPRRRVREFEAVAVSRSPGSEQSGSPAPVHVFLNVPYDLNFQDLYLAYIAGLVSLGLYPRATIEIVGGEKRLDRIFNRIQACPNSVHDLSRVELDARRPETPRFNMPLELGLAVAWQKLNPERHVWFVFEAKLRRIEKSMSDLNGSDVHIHGGRRKVCSVNLLTHSSGRSARRVSDICIGCSLALKRHCRVCCGRQERNPLSRRECSTICESSRACSAINTQFEFRSLGPVVSEKVSRAVSSPLYSPDAIAPLPAPSPALSG